MGMALGILGMTTFLSMFGVGILLNKNGHKNDRIKELENENETLKKMLGDK